tara:strand:+ start:202 stop:834 length:633 start_codon:yes stop_codon:yes gene_type:complete
MSTSENIIRELLSGNLSSARTQTEELLYSKMSEALETMTQENSSYVYEDSVGVASLVEKKKSKKKSKKKDEYAKKTDKEDDGEGLDPVDAEDSDIDNDGDSDESDSYLKNRRKVRKKAIKGEEEVNENERARQAKLRKVRRDYGKVFPELLKDKDDEDKKKDVKEDRGGDHSSKTIYGMEISRYRGLTDKQKHAVKMKWHHSKSHEEKGK